MGNSLRCCLACVLPCGALDLIRIVHSSGYVEEITRPITAGEVLKANPNHVISKPSSQGVVRRILILSPETELKRGSIYFLIPSSSLSQKKRYHLNKKGSSKNVISNKCDHDDDFSSQQCHGCLSVPTDHDIVSKERNSSRGIPGMTMSEYGSLICKASQKTRPVSELIGMRHAAGEGNQKWFLTF